MFKIRAADNALPMQIGEMQIALAWDNKPRNQRSRLSNHTLF